MGSRAGSMAEVPPDRGAHVLLLETKPVRPGSRQIRGHVIGIDEPSKVLGVATHDVVAFGLDVQELRRELADGRQHPKPRLGAGRIDAHEAMAGQDVERVECVELALTADDRGRVQVDPPREDREHRQQSALGIREQSDAPLDGRPERPLPLREVDRTRAERVDDALEAARRATGSRSRVRAAASSIASGTPSRRVQISRTAARFSGVHGMLAADGIRSIDEQALGGEVCVRRRVGTGAGRESSDDVFVLGAEAQHRPARGEDLQPRAVDEQIVELGGDVLDLLEVVEHEDRGLFREVLDERVPGRPRSLEDDPGLAGDAGDDVESGTQRLEGDERHRTGSFSATSSATAMASRVLPIPPGPVSVTRRTSGRSSSVETAATSASLPISEVDVRGASAAVGCGGPRRGSGRGVHEALAQKDREVIAHQPAELARGAERAVRVRALRAQLVDHRGEPGLPLRRRSLEVEQPRARSREPELVLESRDVHPGPDQGVALPVQADEDVGLGEVGPVQLLRRVRPRAEFEHDRREAQRGDGAGARRPVRRPAPRASS